jgi:prepilin-type N-terminal cleavage/methylation domain-containing protein
VKRQRGVTLIELMIAMSLAAIMSAFMLMLTRSQLIAYETSDQITRTQQNARAGIDFLELKLRRACIGSAYGRFVVMVPGLGGHAAGDVVPCVRYWNGASQSGGTFTNGATSEAADAIEILAGDTPVNQAEATANGGNFATLNATPPTLVVSNPTAYSNGDLVIVSTYYDAFIFKVTDTSGGKLTFTASGTPVDFILTQPNGTPVNEGQVSTTTLANLAVMKLSSYSIYLNTAAGPFQNMLVYDSDGMFGTAHNLDGLDASPLVDGVEDFQLALGYDSGPPYDGVISDAQGEYINQLGALNAFTTTQNASAGYAWNYPGNIQLRTIRATLLLRTINTYSGTPYGPQQAIEDRSTWLDLGLSVSGTPPVSGPKLRMMRTIVAPRIWNLTN